MQQCCIVSSVRQERPADLFATKLLIERLKISRQQRKQPASDQFMLHFSITNLTIAGREDNCPCTGQRTGAEGSRSREHSQLTCLGACLGLAGGL